MHKSYKNNMSESIELMAIKAAEEILPDGIKQAKTNKPKQALE